MQAVTCSMQQVKLRYKESIQTAVYIPYSGVFLIGKMLARLHKDIFSVL